MFLLFESSSFCARPDRSFELETKHVIFIMLDTFPKDFSQVAIFQMYNFQSGKFLCLS